MFLSYQKVEELLGLIRRINAVSPWKDPQGFFAALNRLVPFDRSVAFLRVDSKTHQILPSPLTVTNLGAVDSFQEHNGYFWQFKQPIIEEIAKNKFRAFHVPTVLPIYLSRKRFQEYQFDYWEKHKIRFCYAFYTKGSQGYMATYLSRSPGRRDFSEEERMLLDLLSPHLDLVAAGSSMESATFFADAIGKILWLDARAETEITGDPAFAAKLRRLLPIWLGGLSSDPLKPLRGEMPEKGTNRHFVVSRAGTGKSPLFRVSWTSAEEAPPLSAEILNAFAREYHLAPREKEILTLAVAGRQMKEMAQQLGLAVDTVKEYLGSVYRKVGVDGRGPLVARVLSEALARSSTRA